MTVEQPHGTYSYIPIKEELPSVIATIKITMTTRNKTFDLIHFSCVYFVKSCNWHPRPTPPANNSCMPSPVSPHRLLSLSSLSFLLVGSMCNFND